MVACEAYDFMWLKLTAGPCFGWWLGPYDFTDSFDLHYTDSSRTRGSLIRHFMRFQEDTCSAYAPLWRIIVAISLVLLYFTPSRTLSLSILWVANQMRILQPPDREEYPLGTFLMP